VHRVTWFESLMRRTKTMSDEEKSLSIEIGLARAIKKLTLNYSSQ
jgi:hypothetical protein